MTNGGQFKQKLKAGETVIGLSAIVPSPVLIDVLGHAGMDFCMIDTEHGPLGMESATNMVIAADGTGVAPIIRAADNNEKMILRALDIGAAGVQVPQINSVDDAQSVIRYAKYVPMGERGLSAFTRAGNYFSGGSPSHTDRQNQDTCIVVHIEGKRGLDNLDQILQVDGIDVYFLGPFDISQSLGMPGDVRHPTVEAALQTACEKAKRAGKCIGSFAKDMDMGRWLLGLGVQYMLYSVDATIYLEACERIVGDLRS